jgi:hypothetical protein
MIGNAIVVELTFSKNLNGDYGINLIIIRKTTCMNDWRALFGA